MTALAERNSWAAEGVDDLLKFSRKASQEEPQLVRTLRGHRGAVHGVAFSPTRRQLASTGGDGAVMLWSFGMRDEATRRDGVHGVASRGKRSVLITRTRRAAPGREPRRDSRARRLDILRRLEIGVSDAVRSATLQARRGGDERFLLALQFRDGARVLLCLLYTSPSPRD